MATDKEAGLTPKQAAALRELIRLDRKYLMDKGTMTRDDRGLEIGWEVDAVTARALIEKGWAESVDTGRNVNPWLFLCDYNPDKNFGD